MKCPKCGVEHLEIDDRGGFVRRKIDVCYICGFVVKSSDSEQFMDRCAEMIQRHITNFKRTKDNQHVYKAEVYFQALKEEVKINENR